MRPNRVARRRVLYECCLAPLKLGLFGPLALYVCAACASLFWPEIATLRFASCYPLTVCFIFLPSYSALRSFVFVSPKPCCGIEILGDQVIISNKRTMAPDSGKRYQKILAKQSSYKSHWAQPSANSGHWQKASKATKRPRDIICQSSTSWNRFCHIVSTKILPCWCRTPVLTGPSHHLVPPDFASGRFITEIGSTFTHFHSVANNQIPMGQSWVGPKGWSQAFLPGVHHDGLTTQTLTVQSRDGLESLPKPPKLNLRTGWLNHVESVEFQKMDKNCT